MLVRVSRRDELQEVALGRAAGHDRRLTGIAALQDARFQVESEAALLLVGAVTLQAVLLEDGLDLTVKLGRGSGQRGGADDQHDGRQGRFCRKEVPH